MDLNESQQAGENRTHLAQDKDLWKNVVNTVTNLLHYS
jgi:hypothetical protein